MACAYISQTGPIFQEPFQVEDHVSVDPWDLSTHSQEPLSVLDFTETKKSIARFG